MVYMCHLLGIPWERIPFGKQMYFWIHPRKIQGRNFSWCTTPPKPEWLNGVFDSNFRFFFLRDIFFRFCGLFFGGAYRWLYDSRVRKCEPCVEVADQFSIGFPKKSNPSPQKTDIGSWTVDPRRDRPTDENFKASSRSCKVRILNGCSILHHFGCIKVYPAKNGINYQAQLKKTMLRGWLRRQPSRSSNSACFVRRTEWGVHRRLVVSFFRLYMSFF